MVELCYIKEVSHEIISAEPRVWDGLYLNALSYAIDCQQGPKPVFG